MVKPTKNKKPPVPGDISLTPSSGHRSLLTSLLPHYRDNSIDLVINNSKPKVNSSPSASNLSSVLRSSKGRSKTSLAPRSRLNSGAAIVTPASRTSSVFPLVASSPAMSLEVTVNDPIGLPDPANGSKPVSGSPAVPEPANGSTTASLTTSHKRKKSTSKPDSSGILSSIFSAAHNAAHIISTSYEEPAQAPKQPADAAANNTSFSGRLDSLLKAHKNKPESSAASRTSDGPNSAMDDEDGPNTDPSTAVYANDNLLPSSIHFSSIRESPINTLGQGDLLLSHFDVAPANEQKPQDKSLDKATVFQTVDNSAALGGDSLGADLPKQRRSSSLKKPTLSPNQSTDHLPLSDIKRSLSPDIVNRSLPASGQLTVSGNGDSKSVARKSVDEDITADEGNDSHEISDNESGSNNELDNIIDYKDIGLANKKRNKEFHQVFKKIPHNEALIDDFSCALSKDILVQGRLYLSERYVCFNSNILGWTTNVVIPLQEVIQIEKKSTAGLFPNGMVIRTLHHKYVFATFLSRDLTFNILISVWHRGLLEGVEVDPNQLVATAHSKKRRRGYSKSSMSKLVFSDETEGIRSTSNYSDSGISDEELSDDMANSGANDSDDKSLSSVSLKEGKKPPLPDDDGYATEDGSYNGDHGHMDEMFPKNESKEDLKHVSSSSSTGKAQTTPSKGGGDSGFYGLPNAGPATHEPTETDYVKQLSEVFITEDTFKAPLGVVFNILFGEDNSYYIKILQTQKNFEILESDITGLSTKARERHYTYIKPLSGPIGPKQTKCFIVDKLTEFQLKKYVLVEQITSTPDVPSGNSFQVKTKIFLSWGENNSTKIYVVTMIEWSGKSWIKAAIEKGSIDGQKDSMKSLVETINEIIDDAKAKSGGGKSRRGTTSSRRRKTIKKSKKQAAAISEAAQAPPKEEGISTQLSNLVSAVGKTFVPIDIPMIGDSIKGLLVLFVFFWVVMRSWNWLFGYSRGQSLVISDDQFVSRLSINNHKFVVIPRPESYMDNRQRKMKDEIRLWEWLNDRSEGKIRIKDNSSDSCKKAKIKAKATAELQEEDYLHQYSTQEMKEIVKITQIKLDEINKQLV